MRNLNRVKANQTNMTSLLEQTHNTGRLQQTGSSKTLTLAVCAYLQYNSFKIRPKKALFVIELLS